VKLFGGESKRFRVVPRSATDTTPLDPKIADALREAGKDPSKFTVEPFEQGEAESPRRLSAIERLAHLTMNVNRIKK
jgi:signal recognition particle subunit SEC65